MNLLKSSFDALNDDAQISCSCVLGENVRTMFLASKLSPQYAWWFGEAVCFVVFAQKKLVLHGVGALHCFWSTLISSQLGKLKWQDSWVLLLSDLPRLYLLLYILFYFRKFLSFVLLCRRNYDRYGMGARLLELRTAEMENYNKHPRKAISSLIAVARKQEHDRLFDYLLISPRYIWNGPFFGKIRNSTLGRLYLLLLWLCYFCPIILRMSLLLNSMGLSDTICSGSVPLVREMIAFVTTSLIMFISILIIPWAVYKRTDERRYY